MHGRFITNLLLLLLAATLTAFALSFGPATTASLALGVGSATVLVSLVGFALAGRGTGQRVLDLALALTGGWLIVSSRCLPAGDQRWLTFSAAVAIVALAATGLAIRELMLARALRRLRPRPAVSTNGAGSGSVGDGFVRAGAAAQH